MYQLRTRVTLGGDLLSGGDPWAVSQPGSKFRPKNLAVKMEDRTGNSPLVLLPSTASSAISG